jgi:hypothetical protein
MDEWKNAAYEVMTVSPNAKSKTGEYMPTEEEYRAAEKAALHMAFKRGYERLEGDKNIGLLGEFVWCAYVGF